MYIHVTQDAMTIWPFVVIRAFCSDTYIRVAGANKRMLSRLWRYKKRKFYEMEAETFYILVFFWFDDKIVINCKTSVIFILVKQFPYIRGTTHGKRIVKWNMSGDFSDYSFVSASGYREELLKWKIKSKGFIYNQCAKVGGIYFQRTTDLISKLLVI